MTSRVSDTSGFGSGAATAFPASEGKYSSVLSKACLPVALSATKIYKDSVEERFFVRKELPFGSPRYRPRIADYNFEPSSDSEPSSDEDEIESSVLEKFNAFPQLEQGSVDSGYESEDLDPLLESLETCTLHVRRPSISAVEGVSESVVPLPSTILKQLENRSAALAKDPCKSFRPPAPKLLAKASPFFDLLPLPSLHSTLSRLNLCDSESGLSSMSEQSSPKTSPQNGVLQGISPDSSILLTMGGLYPISEEPDNSLISESASSASRPLEDFSRRNGQPLRAKRRASESLTTSELQVPDMAASSLQRRKLEEPFLDEKPLPKACLEERRFDASRAGKQKKHPISISESSAFQRRNRRKADTL